MIDQHLNFDWIPPSDRTPSQLKLTHEFHDQVGTFAKQGRFLSDPPERVILHELEIKVLGQLTWRIWQRSGSCLPPSALVRMASGEERMICEIAAGDVVVSHTGQPRIVLGSQCKHTTEKMREIKVSGWADTLRCTDGHVLPVWNGTDITWTKAEDVQLGDKLLVGTGMEQGIGPSEIDILDYVHAADLDELADAGHGQDAHGGDVSTTHRRTSAMIRKAHELGLVGRSLIHVPGGRLTNATPRTIAIDANFGRLVGLYLAEGSCDRTRVAWTISSEEEHLAQDISNLCHAVFGVRPIIYSSPNKPTCIHVRLGGTVYSRLFKALIPGVAYTKRVPAFVFCSGDDVREAVFSGWFDGDGCTESRDKGERLTGVSSSRGLIRDMATILTSLGVPSSTSVRKAYKKSRESYAISPMPVPAACRLISSSKISSLDVYGHCSTSKITPFGMARRVVSNTDVGVPSYGVWDIEVSDDNTFIADGFVVHNCVGAGGARAYCHAQLGDIAIRGDAEELKVPFPFATYGVGRELAGMNGPGEGSFGGAQAKAIEQFGMLPYDDPRLPQPDVKGGWATWTAKQEIQWSHPRGWPVKRSELEPDSTQHQIMTVTKASSIEDVVQGLAQSYGVTIACNFGTDPKVEGDVMLGRWTTSWAHQQSVAGYWQHPQHGLIFIIDNQWNDVHGDCPTLSKLGVNGSYWMLEKDLAKIIKSRDGEVYLHSNVEGFPLRKIDWGNMGIGS